MTMPAGLYSNLAAHLRGRFLNAATCDLCGKAKSKRVTVCDAAKVLTNGVALCARMAIPDAPCACRDRISIGFLHTDPDAAVYRVSSTLVPGPWAPDTPQVLAAPAPPIGAAGGWFDPSHILQTIATRFADPGPTPVFACKLEFTRMRREKAGSVPSAARPRTVRVPGNARVLALDKPDALATFRANIDVT